MRTFIAIDIPGKIREKIVKIQNQLPEFHGKKTEQENLHLTLKFLGELSEEKLEKVKKRLEKIKADKFDTEISSMGTFSDRIIWLKMKNCDELQKKVDDALQELFKKEDRFMGHLTIARIKRLEGRKKFIDEVKKIKFDKMNFTVCDFRLKKSILSRKGSVYEDSEIYHLD